MDKKLTINIFGGGHVATHLAREILSHPQLQLNQIYNRHLPAIQEFSDNTHITNSLSQIKKADIFILAISDAAIEDFSNKLSWFDTLVVHTAGSLPMSKLKTKRKGVFYPFQSFTKTKKQINFKEIPILIEASKTNDLNLLAQLGHLLSNKVIIADSKKRQALHIAGVFAANFVNHLYTQAYNILKSNNLPFDLLHPLILEVAQKVQQMPPQEAQTGPAARNDQKIIDKHLTFLNTDNQNKIYKLLTESIRKEKNHG